MSVEALMVLAIAQILKYTKCSTLGGVLGLSLQKPTDRLLISAFFGNVREEFRN